MKRPAKDGKPGQCMKALIAAAFAAHDAEVAELVELLSDVLGATSDDPDFNDVYDRAEVLVERYRPPAKKTKKAKARR